MNKFNQFKSNLTKEGRRVLNIGIVLLVVIVGGIVISAIPKPFLTVPTSVEASKTGVAKITGKTMPDTKVAVKYGTKTNKIVADKNGKFSTNVTLKNVTKVAEITVSIDSKTKKIEIKPNHSLMARASGDISSLKLSVPATVEVNEDGIATIEGKTEPNAKVTIGLGILGDSTTADDKGNFVLTEEMSATNSRIITINATLDDYKTKARVDIKANKGVAKKASSEATKEKAAAKKASSEYAKKASSESVVKAASKSSAKAESVASSSTASSTASSVTPSASVPSDYISALNKAQSYSSWMYMSKAGLYEQLTSEYGEKFSTEAAQYAIDNLHVDYNNNALEKARSYRDDMDMSPEEIREQLTSEYGEKFTPEEADYAIQHLND
jgi:hypothetical protein